MIKKFLLEGISINNTPPVALQTFQLPPLSLNMFNPPNPTPLLLYITKTGIFSPSPAIVNKVGSSIIGRASNTLANGIFGDDSELGRNLGTIFSSGLNSAGDTILNNALKKTTLTDGLTQNLGASVGGATAGLAANYLGRGITSVMGNSNLGKFTGQSIATAAGTIGAKALSSGTSNLFGTTKSIKDATQALKAAKTAGDTTKIAELSSKANAINPLALGMSAVGMGLQAALGPSKEYLGEYGNITKGMDTAYDAIQMGVGFVPGVGQVASGVMALNKGLSNLFGSTSGMTKTDAILGSAFMPAPIKWLNMAGAKTTDTFKNLSWQNTEKTTAFMQNAFGNLGDKFDRARKEAGKTYGTFSRSKYRGAQDNINFANNAWGKILNMTDQNEYQNIRSSDMASINNQKYALWILGGFSPLARGKQGMKILNNSINHNLGLRLLSGAALIDNKQMILSKCKEVD